MTKKEKNSILLLSKKIINLVSKNEKKIYMIFAVFTLFILLFAGFNLSNVKKIFAFFLYVLIGGALKYLITRYKIWLEFTPVAFFCVIIAKTMGLFWIIPYIFFTDIMMTFLGGSAPTAGSVPYWFWMFIFAVISLIFPIPGFGQYILPIIYFLGGLFIEQFIKGGLNAWRWASSFANLLINSYMFIKLTEFFVNLVI